MKCSIERLRRELSLVHRGIQSIIKEQGSLQQHVHDLDVELAGARELRRVLESEIREAEDGG